MLDLVILAQGEQRSPVFISGNLVFLQFFHPQQLIKLYMEPLEMTFGVFLCAAPWIKPSAVAIFGHQGEGFYCCRTPLW